MSTAQKALDNVTAKKLPFWKLYKGVQSPNNKVSQCDEEENPSKSPEVAADLLREEIEQRNGEAGSYTVAVYRNHNGDKAGFKYTFTIEANQHQPRLLSSNSSHPMESSDDLRERLRREILIEMSLKRIEEKMDAVLAYVVAKESDDKEDDSPALDFLKTFATTALKQKATAAPVIAPGGGFGALLNK